MAYCTKSGTKSLCPFVREPRMNVASHACKDNCSLIVYQVTMFGYISLKEFYHAPLTLPLIIMSFIFAYVCKKRFYHAFAYTPLEVACRDSKENPNLESVYAAYIPNSLKPEKLEDVESLEDARSQASNYQVQHHDQRNTYVIAEIKGD